MLPILLKSEVSVKIGAAFKLPNKYSAVRYLMMIIDMCL